MEKNNKVRYRLKVSYKGLLFRLLFLFCLGIIIEGIYFSFKLFDLQKKVNQSSNLSANSIKQDSPNLIKTIQNLVSKEKIPLKGEKEGRINILLLGMGGEGHKGKYLTDSIMLVSLNTQTWQIAFLSIPRDLYVKIPQTESYTKINALYAYEIANKEKIDEDPFSSIKEAIEEVTGQQVHYFAALDFEGFKKIIEELNGIELEVKEDIYDSRYPGPNYSYQVFELKKGWQHLDAETALKYARVRHVKGGDFSRSARQQQVIQATRHKALSIKTILNPFKINSIIGILGEHFKTNIKMEEIPSFIEIIKEINFHQSVNYVLDAWSEDALLMSTHIILGGTPAYVLVPRANNYSQIYFLTKNIFDLNKIEERKKKIEEENAKILILSSLHDLSKVKNTFFKMGFKKATFLIKNNNLKNVCPDNKNTLLENEKLERKIYTLSDLAEKLDATFLKTTDLNKFIEEKSQEEFHIVVCLSDEYTQKIDQQIAEEQEKELKENFSSDNIINNEGKVNVNSNKK